MPIAPVSSFSMVTNEPIQQTLHLDNLPRTLFFHCMQFLAPHDLSNVRPVNRACNAFSQRVQPKHSLLQRLPFELMSNFMAFLDHRSLTNLGAIHRQMGTLTRHPEALNPTSLISWNLQHKKSFKPVYINHRVINNIFRDELATFNHILEREGKHYLVVLPHPRERKCARHGGHGLPSNVLTLVDLESGKERQFTLDRIIEGCYRMQEPEPALILIDSRGEVKKITLAQILNSQDRINFEEAATVDPAPEEAAITEEDWDDLQWDSFLNRYSWKPNRNRSRK